MAAARELWESRIGDVSADRAGFGGQRLFLVTIDAVGDNPDDTLRDPEAVGGDLAVPFGAPHPKRVGLFAAFYLTEQRLSSYKYKVRVIYAPPVDFTTPANPWELSYSPGFGTENAKYDYRGVPIGPASYSPVTPGPGAPPENPAGELFTVRLPATPRKASETIYLQRDDGNPDEPVRKPAFLTPVERAVPMGSFSLSRTFSGLTTDGMASLAMLGGTVNSEPFMGFRARQVRFVGPYAQAGIGTGHEQCRVRVAYRAGVRVEFARLPLPGAGRVRRRSAVRATAGGA